MAHLPILIIASAATGQLPGPEDKKQRTQTTKPSIEHVDKVVNGALDRFFKSIDGANPNYGKVFGDPSQDGLKPNYDSIFSGDKDGTAPDYKKAFPEGTTAPPKYDSVFGGDTVTPNYDSVLGDGKSATTPNYDSVLGDGKPATTPNYDSVLGDGKPATTPNYDSVFGGDTAKPNYDSVFGGDTAKPNYDSVFGGGTATPDYDSVFSGSTTKPNYDSVFGNSATQPKYDRMFAPAPSVTTKAAWARVDQLGLVPNPKIPGTYRTKDDSVKGLFALDQETGNIYYLPDTGAADEASTPKWDESKPAVTKYGSDEFAWVNTDVPRRVLGAVKLNLVRTLTGHYKSMDGKDQTVWYLQNNGTYWTPDKIDPKTGAKLGPMTFDGTNFLNDDTSKKPLAGTIDAVTLNLFRTGENEYRQQGVPGHFELGADGMFHYKHKSGLPSNSKIQGPQYYDSSNSDPKEHKWVEEK